MLKRETKKRVSCAWCKRPAITKDWREIDGTTGSYPSCKRCFNLSTEYLLERDRKREE